MQPAVEASMISYLADRELTGSMITEFEVREQIGAEVAVQTLAYTLNQACPAQAKRLFRKLTREAP